MAEAEKKDEGELWCTSGRINERWQSGFDDRRRPYIVQRWPENWVEIHPDDAAERGIESGDYVMIYSERVPGQKHTIVGVEGSDFQFSKLMENGHIELTKAAITAVAMVTPPAIKKGVMYMDFLHMSQPANALEGRVVDWISGNYNYKMGVAKVKNLGPSLIKPSSGPCRSLHAILHNSSSLTLCEPSGRYVSPPGCDKKKLRGSLGCGAFV